MPRALGCCLLCECRPRTQLGHYGGMADEIEALKRDKNVLMLELVRLRQQQQASETRMRDMMGRLETTEQRQNTIVGFLARLAQNPTVLQQMVSVAQNVGLQRSLNDGRNGGACVRVRACVRARACVGLTVLAVVSWPAQAVCARRQQRLTCAVHHCLTCPCRPQEAARPHGRGRRRRRRQRRRRRRARAAGGKPRPDHPVQPLAWHRLWAAGPPHKHDAAGAHPGRRGIRV
jgi:hypothetical protein